MNISLKHILFYSAVLFSPHAASAQNFKWFQLLHKPMQLSLEWKQTSDTAAGPAFPITPSVHNQAVFNRQFGMASFHKDLLQLLNWIRFGLDIGPGITIYHDNSSHPSLIFLKAGGQFNLVITQTPSVTPFIAGGYWDTIHQWERTGFAGAYFSAGVKVSFALFKPSLYYILPDEYGLSDIGLTAQISYYYPLAEVSIPQNQARLNAWSVGVYCDF